MLIVNSFIVNTIRFVRNNRLLIDYIIINNSNRDKVDYIITEGRTDSQSNKWYIDHRNPKRRQDLEAWQNQHKLQLKAPNRVIRLKKTIYQLNRKLRNNWMRKIIELINCSQRLKRSKQNLLITNHLRQRKAMILTKKCRSASQWHAWPLEDSITSKLLSALQRSGSIFWSWRCWPSQASK